MLSFVVQGGVIAMLVLVNATKELVMCFGITEKLDHGCPPVQCNENQQYSCWLWDICTRCKATLL